MANWTPESFIGQVFKTLGKHIPPAPGVQSPALWGTQAHLQELFGLQAHSISIVPRQFMFRYLSADHFMEIFRTYYGPIHKAFQALDEKGQAELDADLRAILETLNIAKDGTLQIASDYVDVVIIRA